MKQAVKFAIETLTIEETAHKSTSEYLRRDLTKGAVRNRDELHQYCRYKNLSFREVMREARKEKKKRDNQT